MILTTPTASNFRARRTLRRVRPWVPLLAAVLLGGGGSLAQAPPEVPSLEWCPQSRDCLSWPAVEGAGAYVLYRGPIDGAAGLVSGDAESCGAGTFAGPTTGPTLGDPPPAGGYWYLVTAVNAFGEGSAGAATGGPRMLASAAPCSASGGLVLNEIDYDQPGSDLGEFVEVYNAGAAEYPLAGLALVLVNGTTSHEYARVDLGAVASSLAPGAFLVVGSEAVLATLPAGTPSAALPATIQNGSPDGVALLDTVAGVLLDALSYEGQIHDASFEGVAGLFDLVEGQAAAAEDSSTVDGSLARLPDGADSDDAASDWSFVPTPTPGAPNLAPGSR